MSAEDNDLPASCECDNGHEQNDTVCRYCWNRGWRSCRERWPTDIKRLDEALHFLADRLGADNEDAYERIDMLASYLGRLRPTDAPA